MKRESAAYGYTGMNIITGIVLAVVIAVVMVITLTGCTEPELNIEVSPPPGFMVEGAATNDNFITYSNENGTSLTITLKNMEADNLEKAADGVFARIQSAYVDVERIGEVTDTKVDSFPAKTFEVKGLFEEDRSPFRANLVIVKNNTGNYTVIQYFADEDLYDGEIAYFYLFLANVQFK